MVCQYMEFYTYLDLLEPGEGIHHAMESGKMASQFLQEAIECGNYGEHIMAHFQDRWMAKFGSDFTW